MNGMKLDPTAIRNGLKNYDNTIVLVSRGTKKIIKEFTITEFQGQLRHDDNIFVIWKNPHTDLDIARRCSGIEEAIELFCSI